jgi:enamidase
MSKVLLKNIGTLISGDIRTPVLPGDGIAIDNGRISAIGAAPDLGESFDTMIDCAGATVAPGLMDSHCHSVLMDYTPRQKQIGFLESAVHGGVTTFISAGEVHLSGRPKDPAGAKALAILAAKAFENFRPGGGKVVGGAVILEKGLSEADFKEMAAEGVRLVGEIGLGSVKDPEEAAPMVRWAKAAGMTVMMHTGGTSIPGSSTVTADMVIRTDPDVASHINGGPTAVALDEARRLIAETEMAIEMVHCGNPKMAIQALKLCMEHGGLGADNHRE